MTQQQAKQTLRRQIRSEMAQTSDDYFQMTGETICRRVLECVSYRRARTLFCFVSHGKEPYTYPLLAQALADGKNLCVPLCKPNGCMEAKRIDSLSQLSPGAFGIPEPPADAETFLPSQIDLALIPCLAATRDGKRLGKGGGFYDRFLAEYTGSSLLLCPSRFVLADIPMEAHDILLPQLISET